MRVSRERSTTILHFGTDRAALLLRARNLNQMGYEVLNSSNGFEAIQLGSLDVVDAVVLDQDGNCAEVELVAVQIKRFRPHVPTILLAEGEGRLGRTQELADALVSKRDNVQMLVTALEGVLAKRLPEKGTRASN